MVSQRQLDWIVDEAQSAGLPVSAHARAAAVDGNPLEDIGALRRVVFVMKDGNIYKGLRDIHEAPAGARGWVISGDRPPSRR